MDTTQEMVTPVSKVALDKSFAPELPLSHNTHYGKQRYLSPTTHIKENKDNFSMLDFRFLQQ
jgi:hypothetical protein